MIADKSMLLFVVWPPAATTLASAGLFPIVDMLKLPIGFAFTSELFRSYSLLKLWLPRFLLFKEVGGWRLLAPPSIAGGSLLTFPSILVDGFDLFSMSGGCLDARGGFWALACTYGAGLAGF